MGRIFAIMSGKGGVGKSSLAAALAVYYARQHMRVALIDGDVGLRCADLMLGLESQVVYDLGDLLEKRCTQEDALVSPAGLPNLLLLAAPQLLRAADIKPKAFASIAALISNTTDVTLIDAPAGIGRNLKNVLGAACRPVLVATPDDVSIRDAERLTSLLAEKNIERPSLILNRVRPKMVRRGELPAPDALAGVLDLPLAGVVPESEKLYRAFLQRKTALDCGDKAVSEAIACAASRLLGADTPLPHYAQSPLWKFFSAGGIST